MSAPMDAERVQQMWLMVAAIARNLIAKGFVATTSHDNARTAAPDGPRRLGIE